MGMEHVTGCLHVGHSLHLRSTTTQHSPHMLLCPHGSSSTVDFLAMHTMHALSSSSPSSSCRFAAEFANEMPPSPFVIASTPLLLLEVLV